MPDWKHIVREHLVLLRLPAEREIEVVEELALHFEAAYEDALADGVSEAEAESRALQSYDWQLLECELSRVEKPLAAGVWNPPQKSPERHRGIRMESFIQDLRFGARMLVKRRGFTLIAVLTLALGIGANTAVFTLINALLLRPLPVTKPDELVNITTPGRYASFPIYRDMRAQQNVFTDMMASGGIGRVRLTIPGAGTLAEIDNVQTGQVTASYWTVLAIQPALGRFFTEDDDRTPESSETAGSVAVLSYAFWERQFGRDPGVLGRTLLVGRSACRVIGVAPRGFAGESVGSEPDVWIPLISSSPRELLENRHGAFTAHMARLKPGVSREQAETAMTLLYRRLVQTERAQDPPSDTNRVPPINGYTIRLESGATGLSFGNLRRTFTRPLWIVMAIVGLVLLIACANVANLLLARAAARKREISVRLAIGCSRFRLVRQLLTESLLLSALGTLAGLLVAWWGSRALLALVDTGSLPMRLNISPDVRVLMFTLAIMALTGFVFGIVPAWRAGSFDLTSSMKEQSRGMGQGSKQNLGRAIVGLQVALSLLLLISASLLIRSLHNLRRIDTGFNPQQVLIFELAHNPRNGEATTLVRTAREVCQRIEQIPGIQKSSVSWLTLFGRSDVHAPLKIQDYAPARGEDVEARFNAVSSGYFQTVGMTVVAGRSIEDRDAENAPRTAVINEAMARRYFRDGNALGRTMEIDAGPLPHRAIEIVGIVRDAKYNDLRAEVKPMFYMSIQQLPRTMGTLQVRTTEPMSAIVTPVRNALSEVTKDVMVRRVVTLSAQVDATIASERLIATLCSFFGALAVLLACIGLYGVLSYAVTQRTQEIGVRMALGATNSSIRWLAVRQSLAVVLAGIALGSVLAIYSTRLISSFLYGLTPSDPLTIVFSAFLLVVVALLACYFPAMRATRVDPLTALRHE